MTLKGKVVQVMSASEHAEGKRLVTIKVADAANPFDWLRVPSDTLGLDDQVSLDITLSVLELPEPVIRRMGVGGL